MSAELAKHLTTSESRILSGVSTIVSDGKSSRRCLKGKETSSAAGSATARDARVLLNSGTICYRRENALICSIAPRILLDCAAFATQ